MNIGVHGSRFRISERTTDVGQVYGYPGKFSDIIRTSDLGVRATDLRKGSQRFEILSIYIYILNLTTIQEYMYIYII